MIIDNRKEVLESFLKQIDFKCDNLELLDVALTHSSYTFENKLSSLANNERLEFLGDAVLKLITSEYLYNRFPEYSEGELTKIRSILISDNTLTKFSQKLNLGNYMEIGYHEEKTGGRHRDSTLACAFESILGAFYMDGKYEQIKPFLINQIIDEVTLIDQSEDKYNQKALLQEYSQGVDGTLPEYILKSEEGPAHNKTFNVDVYINGNLKGSGVGKTKKEAQQEAAKQAINNLAILSKDI